MMRKRVGGIYGLAACAAMCCAAMATPSANAGTIIKLNLGGVGPDVSMPTNGGVFGTVDQTGGPPPTGDQLTNIEYTDFLNFIPDVNTNTASFSLTGLNAVGLASVAGTLVTQNYTGGVFSLYDPSDNLLLQGPIGASALTGTLGTPGTGAVISTSLTTVTGGSLAGLIAPGSVSLSMALTNVNGGSGFAVSGGGPVLNAFQSDGSISIAANPVPEPASLGLLAMAAAGVLTSRRRRIR